MKILVACEYSQRVCAAFTKRGHYAMSCDYEPPEQDYPHYQGDVMDVIHDGWDMMIAHPPCTYLANSGVRWLWRTTNGTKHRVTERWEAMHQACAFFAELAAAHIDHICIENPIIHKYARARVGPPDQIVQPWMFGETETKATCLWLKNLPPLVETNNVKEAMMQMDRRDTHRVHMTPPGPDRWKDRSRTYVGIAEAMAAQWG